MISNRRNESALQQTAALLLNAVLRGVYRPPGNATKATGQTRGCERPVPIALKKQTSLVLKL
jgi:hypothetical protein